MMTQALLFPNGSLRSPAAFFPPPLKLGHPRSIYGAEITDAVLRNASQSGTSRFPLLSIRSEGNRGGRPRKDTSRNKTRKEADRLKDLPTSNGEASNSASQDEIIALFRRIQTSISKGRPATPRRRNLKSQKEKKTGEPIPKDFEQEQVRVPRKDDGAPEKSGLSEEVARPVSKFVKKSPIPSPSLVQAGEEAAEEQLQSVTRNKVADERQQALTTDRESNVQNIDELKLPELKELAKRRGIKGYSKLKKGELLELLKGLSESA
ncbi:Rho termination factor, N-terminal domain [Musa troglodytarum]|uniref:Rho termination factor, N-terminal domain n=1 Tax=Musa troglodytarum TaxID=320322 RepID=A0A9E7JMK5_9LILI|nr:Rho termination factor, N-terminal domain [Musa troglodytarum]